MRGIWLKNLFIFCCAGNISIRDAVVFSLARIKRKPISLNFNGIQFEDVDHIFWSLLADVYINRVYIPSQDFEIRKDDIIVDIGAHKGSFISFAATSTNSKVYAFEPHPGNFKKLEELVINNKFTNVEINNIAIGSKNGKEPLFLSSANSRHNLYGYEVGTDLNLNEYIEVNVRTLNDCLKDIEKIDLLKMDCEGAEIDILLNANDETLLKIQKLVAEIHDPINSKRIENLSKWLSRIFPNIRLVQQRNSQYGYLYAHQ